VRRRQALRAKLLAQASRLEEAIDRTKRRLGTSLRPDRPLRVEPYLGYGTRDLVRLRGRVLLGRQALGTVSAEDSPLINLMRALRRFETDEVPDAELAVALALGGEPVRVLSDEEGYFHAELEPPEPLPAGGGWHPLEIDLLSPRGREVLVQPARVMVPPADADLIVVSDLDDTVIHTDATNLLKMVRNTVLGNSRTRMPFPGVAPFYKALTLGDDDAPRNGLFYVSSSPWNLYGVRLDFLEINGIPHGPLFLGDWGLSPTQLVTAGHDDHKGRAIRDLLALYPRQRFVLIGDSGQEDPEIYSRIVHEHGDRVAAVYIRNLPLEDVERPETVRRLAKEVEQAGSTLLLVDTTYEAAEHAADRGWISHKALGEIARAVGKDLAPAEEPGLDIVEEEDRPEPASGEPDAKDVAKEAAPRSDDPG
jgi:phosphatidate phosphatase APP1